MSIAGSSTFRAAQDGFGEYYHGQTTLHYDEDGNLVNKEHKMVMLWSDKQEFDKDLYINFVPVIEITKEKEKQHNSMIVDSSPHVDLKESNRSKGDEGNNGNKEEILLIDDQSNVDSTKQLLKRTRDDENLSSQLKHCEEENDTKELIDSEVKPEPTDYICVYTDNGTLIHTMPIYMKKKPKNVNSNSNSVDKSKSSHRAFITYETVLVAACQIVEEQLGASLNYHAFKLFDKSTNSEIQMHDPITKYSSREITIKMSKGNPSNRSSSPDKAIKIL